jgi:hypothetical protein
MQVHANGPLGPKGRATMVRQCSRRGSLYPAELSGPDRNFRLREDSASRFVRSARHQCVMARQDPLHESGGGHEHVRSTG